MLIIICSVWRHKIYLKCMEESKQSYKSTEQSMKKIHSELTQISELGRIWVLLLSPPRELAWISIISPHAKGREIKKQHKYGNNNTARCLEHPEALYFSCKDNLSLSPSLSPPPSLSLFFSLYTHIHTHVHRVFYSEPKTSISMVYQRNQVIFGIQTGVR